MNPVGRRQEQFRPHRQRVLRSGTFMSRDGYRIGIDAYLAAFMATVIFESVATGRPGTILLRFGQLPWRGFIQSMPVH